MIVFCLTQVQLTASPMAKMKLMTIVFYGMMEVMMEMIWKWWWWGCQLARMKGEAGKLNSPHVNPWPPNPPLPGRNWVLWWWWWICYMMMMMMIMKITFFQQWRPAWPCNEKASANLLRNLSAQNFASVEPIWKATSTCITQTPKCFLPNSVCDLYDPKPHSKSVWPMTFGSFWAAHIIALHLWRRAYAPFRHKNQHSYINLYDPTV